MSTSWSIALFLFLTLSAAIGIVVISYWLGRKPLTAGKDVPYECGVLPMIKPETFFSIRFYKMALLFLVFDIEIVFLYLWAVAVRSLGLFGLIEMLVFIIILLIALFYVWWKGDLSWE